MGVQNFGSLVRNYKWGFRNYGGMFRNFKWGVQNSGSRVCNYKRAFIILKALFVNINGGK
jgi:hypothetical protein